MCTLTIIRHKDPLSGQSCVRLAFNRDEQRTRPAARPPEIEQFGRQRAILPRDPKGGGTWIAVSDAGVGLALMNAYAGGALPPPGEKSRGLIIPSLLECDTLASAVQQALNTDVRPYAPFRLIVLDDRELVELANHGPRLRVRSREPLELPRFFASSGLGDRVVDGPRREVFEEFLIREAATPQRQDALHHHCWPDRPHLSVCMSRLEARTVSFTTIEIRLDRVSMHYQPIAESSDGPPAEDAAPTHWLPRVASGL